MATFWSGGPPELRAGQPVLLGFCCDEGVRRNGGRPGAAEAPSAIRSYLYRLTAQDPRDPPGVPESLLDLGDISPGTDLEGGQVLLGAVVGAVLRAGAVPVVLGGGHETAFGHFLGYVEADLPTAIVNLDAHLDVRPYPQGAHSGSPFRQATEHPRRPMPVGRYVCIGAQPHAVSREHAHLVTGQGGRIHWSPIVGSELAPLLLSEVSRLAADGMSVYVTLDADVAGAAEVPSVSWPNVAGLPATSLLDAMEAAGREPRVRSVDLVEINPTFDEDGRSARWAALAVWRFLRGLRGRPCS